MRLRKRKYITAPIAADNADNEEAKGQGLGSTKWKPCRWEEDR
jgi:hypothetical protein